MQQESTDQFTIPAANGVRWTAPPDAGFDLRHLRYFVAVAEHRHFSRAARALNITQPPLTRQIQDLEYHLGAQLLHRSSKSVTLTPEGRVFLAESKKILSQVCQSLQTVRRTIPGEAGSLDIGFPALAGSELMLRVRSALMARKTTVCFHCLETAEQIRLIRRGILGAGLVLLPVKNQDEISIAQVFRLPAVALVAGTHPFAAYSKVSVREIAAEATVDVRDDSAMQPHNPVEHIGTICGAPIHIKRHVADLDGLFHDVRLNGSVAIVPCCVDPIPGLSCIPVMEWDADFTFGLAWLRDREDRVLKDVLEMLHEMTLSKLF